MLIFNIEDLFALLISFSFKLNVKEVFNSTDMKPLKIFWFPHGPSNPYQYLLIDRLKTFGLNIKLADTRNFFFCNITILNILLTNWKPDIMHLHWHHSSLVTLSKFKSIVKSTIFLFQIYLLKLLNIKLVWTIHNLTHHEDRQKQIELFFCRFVGNLADAIITHCERAQVEVAKVFKIKKIKKIHVIPHGNFIKFYENKISKEKAKKKLRLSEPIFNFLFLGEIRPYKGIKELISAFKKVDNTGCQPIGLIIAGRPKNDEFAVELRRLIKGNKNIYLVLKYISDNEIQIYLKAADIVVFPYRKVFTSGGILLAMSFGKPIIAPRLGCISDVLDHSGSYLYDPMHSNELYETMKKAVFEKSRHAKMGSHNLNMAKRFNWTNMARNTRDIYLDLLKI